MAKRRKVKQCLSRKKPGIQTGSSGCVSVSVCARMGVCMCSHVLAHTCLCISWKEPMKQLRIIALRKHLKIPAKVSQSAIYYIF